MIDLQLSPGRLLTIADYLALGETELFRTELQERNLVIAPNPGAHHQIAVIELAHQFTGQVPDDLDVIPSLDIDLEFAPAEGAGSSRRPDVIVARRSARRRLGDGGGMIRASEVLIVAEVVTIGSRRTDHLVKRAEYADAGIPFYWIVDLDEPVSVVACHRAGEFGYQDGGAVIGRFSTSDPFDVTLELDALR